MMPRIQNTPKVSLQVLLPAGTAAYLALGKALGVCASS